MNRVQEVLREVGKRAFADERLHRLLLDPPSVMGVESLALDEVNLRIVARTLPGKQFEVGRRLRARIVVAFHQHNIAVSPASVLTADREDDEDESLDEDYPTRGSGS